MNNSDFETQAFASYYLFLGLRVASVDTDYGDLAVTDHPDEDGLPLTRIVTRGPDGSMKEISSRPSRASRRVSMTKALQNAIATIKNAFRPRRRSSDNQISSTAGRPGANFACPTCVSPIADDDIEKRLLGWSWPSQRPSAVLCRDFDPVNPLSLQSTNSTIARSYELGLDYDFVERAPR